MTENRKNSSALAHLTWAALALPGAMQTAAAGRVEETYNADFQYGHYAESQRRMQVDIFEGVISAPIGKAMTGTVNLVRDSISGASPVYNTRNARGEITQIISGASPASFCGESICETRDAISTNLSYFFDRTMVGFGGGYSREHDYTSKFFNTAGSLDFNKKMTTLNAAASLAFDEIEPSPSPYTNPPFDAASGFKGRKTSQQYLLGVAQIIDKNTVVKTNLTLGYHNGFMTDPYKQVAVYGDVNFKDFGFVVPEQETIISEKRPGHRLEWAWLTQAVRHFGELNHAALRADYRFSANSWGVNAHTVELNWHQPVIAGWQVNPSFRYYSQDQADFFRPVFDSDVDVVVTDFAAFDLAFQVKDHPVYSSDYRLAGFGTVSGGVQISNEINALKPFEQIRFQAGLDYFSRKAAYQLGGTGRNDFADFNYYLVTASFNLKF